MTLFDQVDAGVTKSRKTKSTKAFERLNANVKRHYATINKNRLIVPSDEYQRDESSGRIAQEIAMHYDDVAFGALTVIRRSNGDHVVADGGTRLAAAMMRDDIKSVHCLVFSGMNAQQEADTFLRINMNRKRLRVHQQQQAELFAGHMLATKAEEVMVVFRENQIQFESLSILRGCLKKSMRATLSTVETLPSVAYQKHVSARVFKGLVYLEEQFQLHDSTLYRRNIVQRLVDNFSKLDPTINGAIPARSSGNRMVCAQAIAKALKIRMPKRERE